MKKLLGITLLAMAAACAPALAQPAKATGGVLVNAKGMTLYTFDKDTAGSGASVCNGPCAMTWPPLTASSDAKPMGDWTIITREGGPKQWAYKGKPLYTFVGDANPNDMNGKGVNGVWQLAKP